MTLRPLARTAAAAPSYPPRHASRLGLGGALRRLAVAAGAAVTLAAAGCAGLPGDDNEFEHMAGAQVMPSFFVCADEATEDTDIMWPGGSFQGDLCGESTAWGRLGVGEGVTVTAEVSSPGDGVVVDLITPEGLAAIELRPELPSQTFYLEPGTWTVAVTARNPEDRGWFTVALSPVAR